MLTALLLAASKASVLESERVECVRAPLDCHRLARARLAQGLPLAAAHAFVFHVWRPKPLTLLLPLLAESSLSVLGGLA